MCVSRGLVGSLGAGVSLAAAGSLALLIVSAVVAFQGWPGVSRGTDGPPVTLPSSIRESAATRVPTRIVLGGGVPRTAVVSAGGEHGRRTGPLLAGRAEQIAANPSPVPAASGSADSAAGASAADDPPAPAPAPPSVTPPPADDAIGPPGQVGGDAGATVRQATDGAGAAVQQTANGAGDAVRPAAPEAAGAVEQAGGAASGLVQGAGHGLGGLLGGN